MFYSHLSATECFFLHWPHSLLRYFNWKFLNECIRFGHFHQAHSLPEDAIKCTPHIWVTYPFVWVSLTTWKHGSLDSALKTAEDRERRSWRNISYMELLYNLIGNKCRSKRGHNRASRASRCPLWSHPIPLQKWNECTNN